METTFLCLLLILDFFLVSFFLQSMAEVLAKKEELADRLEKANEEAIASAIAEEEQLTREIEAEENNDINIETDNDSDFSVSDQCILKYPTSSYLWCQQNINIEFVSVHFCITVTCFTYKESK